MAADGAIRIDTSINDAPVNQGTDRMSKNMGHLAEAVKEVIKANNDAFGPKQQKKLDALSQKLQRQQEAAQVAERKANALREQHDIRQKKHADALARKSQKQLESAESAVRTLENLQKKYDALTKSGVSSPSTKRAENELKKVQKEIDVTQKEYDQLLEKMNQVQIKVDFERSASGVISPESAAEIERLEKALDAAGFKMSELDDRSAQLSQSLQQVKMHPEQTIEAQKLANDIQTAEEKARRLTNEVDRTTSEIAELNARWGDLPNSITAASDRAQQLADAAQSTSDQIIDLMDNTEELPENVGRASKNMKTFGLAAKKAGREVQKTNKLTGKMSDAIGKFGKRLMRLAAAAFVFNVIRRGLTSLMDYMNKLLRTNAELSTTLGQIKGNLLTAFQPIYEAALPAIQALANAIRTVTGYLATFMSVLFGKSLKNSQQSAESLYNQANALEDVGDAAKEAAGKLAAFDRINVLGKNTETDQEQKKDNDKIDPVFDFEPNPKVVAWMEEFKKWLQRIWELLEPTRKALANLWEAMKPLGTFVWNSLKDFYEHFLKPVGKWVLGTGLPRFIDAVRNGLEKIDWEKIRGALVKLWDALAPFAIQIGEGLLWFWEEVIVPLATWAMNNLIPAAIELIAAAIRVVSAVIEALKPAAQWLFDNFLKPLAAWVGDKFVEAIEFVTNALLEFADWAKDNRTVIEAMAAAILGLLAGIWVYNTTKKIVDFIGTLGEAFSTLGKLMQSAGFKAGVLGATIAILAYLITQLVGVWDDMTGMEKIVAVLGIVAAAAFAAAIAFGVFQSAMSMGLAIAGIVAGIAAATAAINNAKKRAESDLGQVKSTGGRSFGGGSFAAPRMASMKSADVMSLDVPKLATGAVIPPNQEFLAVLGDQRKGKNIETPEGLLREIVRDELSSLEIPAPSVTLNATGSVAELVRILFPLLEKERDRKGSNLLKGVKPI